MTEVNELAESGKKKTSGDDKVLPRASDAEDKIAKRLARQAEKRSEREAERAQRQAQRQAEREARRAAREKPEAARTVPDAPAKPGKAIRVDAATRDRGKKPAQSEKTPKTEPLAPQRFNILIVAQHGRLAREASLFAASLRRNAPDWKGRLIVAEPRPEGAWAGMATLLDPNERKALEGFGAEILPFTARHFGAAYPHGNKIEALELLPAGEPFVFFDSDTIVTGRLDRVGFDFSRPSASMRRTGTWPEPPLYGPDFNAIWKSLYDRFGLEFAGSLDLDHHDNHWERYLYFNAGWFFGPDPQEFGRRFLEWSQQVRDAPGEALACQSLDPWLDQVVLPLVIHSLGGGRPGPALAGLDGDVTCHYRNLSLLYAREAEDTVALVEELIADPMIAPLFAQDDAANRLVRDGEGRGVIRPMFPQAADQPEQPIRHQLKRAGLWFR
ncbi:hypothetical protein ACHFJ0_07245 [Paracoccus sp. NGMCC 1.201697]|uniref:Glycosyl transferase n=1 Tax=Paracoccus broussonetiae subsp. drimophilus TaxID=3373869 RepID=A0ABW7LIM5_9RHOB